MQLSAINGHEFYRDWLVCDISVKINGEPSNNKFITTVDTSGCWYEKYVTNEDGHLSRDSVGEPFIERVKCNSIEVIINDKQLLNWVVATDTDRAVVDYFKNQE